MMWWWDGGAGWAGWLAMTGSVLLFWALVAWVLVAVVRRAGGGGAATGGGDAASGAGRATAEEILAERYARGELDDEEYRRRREVLRQEHRSRL